MVDSTLTETPAPPSEPESKPPRRGRRSLYIGLIIVAATVVYAFGYQVTDVNLDEIQSETRRVQLVRVLRDLARPDLLTYERIPTNTDVSVQLPCPDGGFAPETVGQGDRQIVVTPACAPPGSEIVVTGTNFSANARGTIYQVPSSGDLELRLDAFQTDENGDFVVNVDTRERAEDIPQTIRAVTRENIGGIFDRQEVTLDEVDDETGLPLTVMSPRVSEAALNTWDRIIETVFLALLATTLGVFIAVPMSFFAARNLMRDISTPVIKLALQLLALPVGIGLGIGVARLAREVADTLTSNGALLAAALVLLPIGIYLASRYAFPPEDETPPEVSERVMRGGVALLMAGGAVVALYLVGYLLVQGGDWLANVRGVGFIGSFFAANGDILRAAIAVIAALITAGVLMSLAGRAGTAMRNRLSPQIVRSTALPVAALAGAVIAVLIARGLGWLYQLTDPWQITWIPAIVGGLFGLYLAVRAMRHESVNIGLTIYYLARTVFNAIRSIEPLIMVIVFVVWVGLGPFAGSLALALHTIAALSKLYSEQVESIMDGPIEAVKATGANRIQTIVYAVIPQIVPPYISFTLYRWDINVRMSTIIGFAGGGGIGFLLQQNIRLLNYRAASVNMLAIAIVVASMDYLSSRVRENIV